jgi:hypothetical protein
MTLIKLTVQYQSTRSDAAVAALALRRGAVYLRGFIFPRTNGMPSKLELSFSLVQSTDCSAIGD